MAEDGPGGGPGDAPLIDLLGLAEILTFSPVILPGGGPGWRFGAGLTWGGLLGGDLPDGLVLWRTVAAGFTAQPVRATGTLGGSLYADAGDARLAVAVCGGTVTYRTRDGAERTAAEAPAEALVLHVDVPVPDASAWVGMGERGDRRDRAGLVLSRAGGRCTGLRLARRIGTAPPERLTAVEAACIGAEIAELPDRLDAAANGCPLVLLLARRMAAAGRA